MSRARLVVGSLLLASVATASQIIAEDVPLAAAVAAADTVVVVKTSKACAHAVQVHIGGHETYERVQNPWSVTAVLRGDPKLAGQLIYVDVYNWQFNVSMMKALRAHLPTPSPIEPRYRSAHTEPLPEMNEPRILFLRKQADGTFVPALLNAVESTLYLDEVKAALEASPRP